MLLSLEQDEDDDTFRTDKTSTQNGGVTRQPNITSLSDTTSPAVRDTTLPSSSTASVTRDSTSVGGMARNSTSVEGVALESSSTRGGSKSSTSSARGSTSGGSKVSEVKVSDVTAKVRLCITKSS